MIRFSVVDSNALVVNMPFVNTFHHSSDGRHAILLLKWRLHFVIIESSGQLNNVLRYPEHHMTHKAGLS